MHNEENLYRVGSLVVVHIVKFQRDLVVMRFIRIELVTCSTSNVDKVHIHVLSIQGTLLIEHHVHHV